MKQNKNIKIVQQHIRKILGNRVKSEAHKKTHFDNAADALAIALTHAFKLVEALSPEMKVERKGVTKSV